MVRRLFFILLAVGIALAPLGAFAHARSHGKSETALKSNYVSSGTISHASDHSHSPEPCKVKLSLGDTGCCSIGCQLVLAVGPVLFLNYAKSRINFDSLMTEQHDGLRPAVLDPPPKA